MEKPVLILHLCFASVSPDLQGMLRGVMGEHVNAGYCQNVLSPVTRLFTFLLCFAFETAPYSWVGGPYGSHTF